MEGSLNLFWFLLSAAALLQCYRRGRAGLRGWVCLGLASLMLFPVISLSDDLHLLPALAEEGSSASKQRAASAGRLGIPHEAPAVPRQRFELRAAFTHVDLARPCVQVLIPFQLLDNRTTRAPPSSLSPALG